jgi:hypothetical protein
LNATFEPARTPLDWLSRDSEVVDAFINDPLCFPELQPASFASFLATARVLPAGRQKEPRTRDDPDASRQEGSGPFTRIASCS